MLTLEAQLEFGEGGFTNVSAGKSSSFDDTISGQRIFLFGKSFSPPRRNCLSGEQRWAVWKRYCSGRPILLKTFADPQQRCASIKEFSSSISLPFHPQVICNKPAVINCSNIEPSTSHVSNISQFWWIIQAYIPRQSLLTLSMFKKLFFVCFHLFRSYLSDAERFCSSCCCRIWQTWENSLPFFLHPREFCVGVNYEESQHASLPN